MNFPSPSMCTLQDHQIKRAELFSACTQVGKVPAFGLSMYVRSGITTAILDSESLSVATKVLLISTTRNLLVQDSNILTYWLLHNQKTTSPYCISIGHCEILRRSILDRSRRTRNVRPASQVSGDP